MTIQPQQPAATAPPGWYPHPPPAPSTLRYWDGATWTANVAPLPAPVVVRPVMATARSQHVSGLTTGQHILFFILTVCTLGLFAPVWALVAFLNRRRVA